MYRGESLVDDQIALQDKLKEFDFVEDSEEDESDEDPQESLTRLVSLILLDHDFGLEVKFEKVAKYAQRFLEHNQLKQ